MPEALFGQARTTPPWVAPPARPADVSAIKALMVGKATEDQQRRVVEWLREATGIGELEFRPDDERASAFASGKRFVGLLFFTLAEAIIRRNEQ